MSAPFITPDARQDILAIWSYIAADSIHHADLVEEAILATCDLAASIPRAGHRRPEFTGRDLFFLPVTAYEWYTVAYTSKTAPIRIIGVFHGARDVRKLFRR